MKQHQLKTHPEPFAAIEIGVKRHEIRKNDRDFQVGDILILKEWLPTSEVYTGKQIIAEVAYITRGGQWGLPKMLCVMTIRTRGLLA